MKYPSDRTDGPVPGHDPSSDSLAESRVRSQNCERCYGEGMATIWHMHFRGVVMDEFESGDGNYRRRLLRTLAYCICEMGEKLAQNHEKTAKDVHKRMPFLSDILAGRRAGWLGHDPTAIVPIDPEALGRMPASFRRVGDQLLNGVRRYFPKNGYAERPGDDTSF